MSENFLSIINRSNCGNFEDLTRRVNVKPLTSVEIPELLRVTERCRNICGGIKSECLEATDLMPEKKDSDQSNQPASTDPPALI